MSIKSVYEDVRKLAELSRSEAAVDRQYWLKTTTRDEWRMKRGFIDLDVAFIQKRAQAKPSLLHDVLRPLRERARQRKASRRP